MYEDVMISITEGALKKQKLYKNSIFKYIVGSSIAGFQVGLGVLAMGLSISIFKGFGIGVEKITNGLIFSLALSLVMLAGGELFTGNILVMTIAVLRKKIKAIDGIKITVTSYIGNFLGSLLLMGLFIGTGISDNKVAKAIFDLSIIKTSYDFSDTLFKGIMCNILVCFAVFCCYKLKSESAKLIMIVWCILPFVALGFEHSVANMTVFSIGFFMSQELTLEMIVHNLIPSTLGNIIGGALVALGYYSMINKNENK